MDVIPATRPRTAALSRNCRWPVTSRVPFLHSCSDRGHCPTRAGLTTAVTSATLKAACSRGRRGRTSRTSFTAGLQLTPDLQRVLDEELSTVSWGREPEVLIVERKEGPEPISGRPALASTSSAPRALRDLAPNSVDIVMELFGEEMKLLAGHEAWQCHFYPLGGHAFSLARTFIVNLASVAKVLRPGGKFLFRTLARSEDDILPFSFLRLPHLAWDVRLVRGIAASSEAVVVCTLQESCQVALARTPQVVEAECGDEESRRRYFDVLQPLALAARKDRAAELSILDVGGGDGSLAAWFRHPEAAASSGHVSLTLMEDNPELAERARQRFAELGSDGMEVVAHSGEPWPFPDRSFDVVVLAFLLHHVRPGSRLAVLQEARRVARDHVLVLEDQPSAAGSKEARDLAWLVTEEHFRPFGQEPAEFLEGVLSDCGWREEFERADLKVEEALPFPGTLRHPVPHIAYQLSPSP